MATLTEGQASFMHDEPNVGVVAALREDGTAHQTVVWVDWDGEHVLLNLNTFRSKLDYLRRDPRVSVLVLDRNNPFRWLRLEGKVARDHAGRRARAHHPPGRRLPRQGRVPSERG